MLGLDLALGQGNDPGLRAAAVLAKGGQFGIVRVGRDDQQALLCVVRIMEGMQHTVLRQPAMAAANAQMSGAQRFALAGEVEVALAADAALEVLTIDLDALDQHLRVKPAAEQRGLHLDLQHQRFLVLRQRAGGYVQAVRAKGHRQGDGALGEVVAVVIARRIEQVVGKPGFMGEPAEKHGQRHAPPGREDAQQDQRQQGDEQDRALLAAVLFEQLLLAGGHVVLRGHRSRTQSAPTHGPRHRT